jgi:psp operon transcriptional activator
LDEILFDPFRSPDRSSAASSAARHLSGGAEPGGDAQATLAQSPAAAELRSEAQTPVAVTPTPAECTDLRAAVAAYERKLLQQALEGARFKQTDAARQLGLSYDQLRGLLKKHGLTPSSTR